MLKDVDAHSRIWHWDGVPRKSDENLEIDERVVKLLNCLTERVMYWSQEVYQMNVEIQHIGESIISMSKPMSLIQDLLQI